VSKMQNDRKNRIEIELFAQAMDVKLDKKQLEYGNSWKDCPIQFLNERLQEEVQELKDSISINEVHNKLVDVANLCMMLWYRTLPLIADESEGRE